MKIKIVPLFALLLAWSIGFSQETLPGKLRVLIDCSNTWCDMQYIRSEINLVDFLLDNTSADVHVLITSQGTGSGGNEYQLILFGQQYFKHQTDTLRFIMRPDATEFETRDALLTYIKAGLVPFIAKTSVAKSIEIQLKQSITNGIETDSGAHTKDPWNAWVMRIGAGGYFNADANYNNKSYNGNITANRITEKTKTGAGVFWSKNKSTFAFAEEGGTESFVVNNHNWSANHYLVKSINAHWSWSYEIKYSQNTFSNNKGRAYLFAGSEVNIFPFSEVNNRLFTLSYGLTARKNTYYDTTIYEKTAETLIGHRATAYLSLNQKWGTSYAGITYHNYFTDWKYFNLGMDVYTSVRISGGLSFYVLAFGGLTRDQVSLVKGNATPEEVLARRRQLASGYNYYTSFGITYRFGSNINNVVNPRFDRSGSTYED